MAYSLVKKTKTVSNSLTEIYVCGGDNAVVIGVSLVNNLTSSIVINFKLWSSTDSSTTDIIAPNTVLGPGESLTPIGGVQKLVMASGDKLQAQCVTSVGLDVICSAMELTT